MLPHEEWVNGGWYESLFGAPPPVNPVRDANRQNFRRVKTYGDWYYASAGRKHLSRFQVT